jgi:hypothetical protein
MKGTLQSAYADAREDQVRNGTTFEKICVPSANAMIRAATCFHDALVFVSISMPIIHIGNSALAMVPGLCSLNLVQSRVR